MELEVPSDFAGDRIHGPARLLGYHYVEHTPFIEYYYSYAYDEELFHTHFYDDGTCYWTESVVESLPQGATALSKKKATDYIYKMSYAWYQCDDHKTKLMANWLENHWIT